MADAAERLSVVREYGETIDVDMLNLADETRIDVYDRTITDDERASYGEEVGSLTNKILDTQEEKKAQTKMYNDQIKADETRRKEVARILRRGTVTTDTKVSTFFDRTKMKVYEYNSLGERIMSRNMKPEERNRFAQLAID